MIKALTLPSVRTLTARLLNEEAIQPISNREATNCEFIDEDSMNRTFAVGAGLTAHQEFPCREHDHFGFDDHVDVNLAGLRLNESLLRSVRARYHRGSTSRLFEAACWKFPRRSFRS